MMDSKSKEDFASIIKNTLLCKRKSPLEFYYKLEQIDDPKYTSVRYTPFYTVTDIKSCTFKGYFNRSDTDNLIIGLNMTIQDKDKDQLVVRWNFSIYDAVQDTFVCLGRSEFETGQEQDISDQISITIETLGNYVMDNTLLLKWTVDKIHIEENGDDDGQIERSDDKQNVEFDLSLESMLDFVSSQTDKFEESKNIDSLQSIKQEMYSCRKQQESNDEKLRSIEAQFQQVDVRLTQLLDTILSQQPLTSETIDLPLRSGTSMDREIGDVVSHTNNNQGLCHMNSDSQLKRARSEPVIYMRSSQVSSEQVLSNFYPKLPQWYTSPLIVQPDSLSKVTSESKVQYTQTEQNIEQYPSEDTDSDDSDVIDSHHMIKNFLYSRTREGSVEETKSSLSHIDQSDISNYERIIVIGYSKGNLKRFLSFLFHNTISFEDMFEKWTKITIELLKMRLYVRLIRSAVEMKDTLTSLLSEDKDLQSLGFHAFVVVFRDYSFDFADCYFKKTFLKNHCIIIADDVNEFFFYKMQRSSFSYRRCRHLFCFNCLRDFPHSLDLDRDKKAYVFTILLAIDSMRDGKTFKISQMLHTQSEDLLIKVGKPFLKKTKEVERDKSLQVKGRESSRFQII